MNQFTNDDLQPIVDWHKRVGKQITDAVLSWILQLNDVLGMVKKHDTAINALVKDVNTLKGGGTQAVPAGGLAVSMPLSDKDREKLDGIECGAEKNPNIASQKAKGLMSAADKRKLDRLTDEDITKLLNLIKD